MGTTTDLHTLRTDPNSEFTWGAIRKFHDFGPYTVIEGFSKVDSSKFFHAYVDGKDLGTSATTLEGAILLCIAYKNLGPNDGRHMAIGACKLLGVPTE